MPARTIITEPSQAFTKMRERLTDDIEPVWEMISSRVYSPFWLLTRELFPVAESIGDLIYQDRSTIKNLQQVLENDFSKIRAEYKGKGALIAELFRHSLTHQDEPRSIYCGGITIHWNIAVYDGSQHLKDIGNTPKRRTSILAFDLRTFYSDILKLLDLYEKSVPIKGKSIVNRYNSWTYEKLEPTDGHKIMAYEQARDFYFNSKNKI